MGISVRRDQCEQSSSRETQDDAATTITRQVTHYPYLVGAMAYYTIKHCSTSQHWAVSVRGDQCEQSSSRETQSHRRSHHNNTSGHSLPLPCRCHGLLHY
ncbi:hypothetical protein J6590_092794 [Homalodisca vitripennis]|nr:hypothetical protein J6590_092794 [Homalodisca vitripennis]